MATYIDRLNAFLRWKRVHYLSGRARLLYYGLLEVFNDARWPEQVQVDNFQLMSLIDTRTEKTVISARAELIEAGLIEYTRGKKRSPNAYRLRDATLESNPETLPETLSEALPKTSTFSRENGELEETLPETLPETLSETLPETQLFSQKNVSHIKNKKKMKMKTKTEEDNVISAELLASTSTPVATLPLNDGTEYAVSEEQCQEWAGLYPAVDVMQQLRGMRAWLVANPKRRKTRRGINPFIVNWLSREQDKGRPYAPAPAAKSGGKAPATQIGVAGDYERAAVARLNGRSEI